MFPHPHLGLLGIVFFFYSVNIKGKLFRMKLYYDSTLIRERLEKKRKRPHLNYNRETGQTETTFK